MGPRTSLPSSDPLPGLEQRCAWSWSLCTRGSLWALAVVFPPHTGPGGGGGGRSPGWLLEHHQGVTSQKVVFALTGLFLGGFN